MSLSRVQLLVISWTAAYQARRGSQGASRAAPGKSGLHARGEGVLRQFGTVGGKKTLTS